MRKEKAPHSLYWFKTMNQKCSRSNSKLLQTPQNLKMTGKGNTNYFNHGPSTSKKPNAQSGQTRKFCVALFVRCNSVFQTDSTIVESAAPPSATDAQQTKQLCPNQLTFNLCAYVGIATKECCSNNRVNLMRGFENSSC